MSDHDRSGPPAKRRKVTPPKERTTEYLDLTKPDHEMDETDMLHQDRLLDALRKKKKIVVIAGAGISVSAGIPDFRSSTGLFATARNQHKLKASGKHLFDASVYKHDSSTQSFHTMVREMAHMTKNAQPTPFHHLLASLAHEGRLMRLYSQNIDCIDTRMPPLATKVPLTPKGPWPATIQLHGGLEKMVCTKCSELKEFDGNVFDGPEAPECTNCKVMDEVRTAHAGKRSHGIGRVRPRFVLYNEYNPDEEAIGNVSSADLKARPDAVIVVGTSLKVPGTRRLVKELCQVTRGRKNGFTAFINVESEPKGVEFKDCWDLVVRAKCDVVAGLAALPPWDCTIGDDYEVGDLDGKDPLQASKFEVHIGGKPKQVDDVQSMPTPRPSPKMAATRPVGNTKQTKQTKISFGAAAAPKNGRGRPPKTKQPAKAEPKRSQLQFKSVKNTAGRPLGKKLDSLAASKDIPSLLALPPLRPRQDEFDRRRSTETYCAPSPSASPEVTLPEITAVPAADAS
jgi:NAD-dependent histone deacetylase SIR2